jgi:hypothetical protein
MILRPRGLLWYVVFAVTLFSEISFVFHLLEISFVFMFLIHRKFFFGVVAIEPG